MTTATYDFEGTVGTYPAGMTGTYGTFTMGSYSAEYGDDSTSDFSISSTVAHGGTRSARLGNSGGYQPISGRMYLASGVPSTTYWRGYMRLSNGLSDSLAVLQLRAGGTNSHTVGMTADGKLFIAGNQSGSNLYQSVIGTGANNDQTAASAVPVGSWFRIEVKATATTVDAKLWTGANLESSGAADYSLSVTTSSIGTPDWIGIGAITWNGSSTYAPFLSGRYLYMDDFAVDTDAWLGSTVVSHSAAAAASETASATAAATRVPNAAAAPSITAGATAVAGLVITADGTPSITAAGSADASVITTHNAEAASTITVSTTDTATLTREMVAASTVTASASATAALDGGADAAVQAIGVASVRIDGETSPGFLYATVAKHILTN